MKRLALPLAALALPLAASVPAAAAEVQIASQGPVVELTVSEIVRSAPDLAQVGAGVTNRAPTARGAVRANAEAMERVVDRIRSLGIEDEDIQTSNFNLSPQYNYNQQTGEQTFVGYQVTNQVNVRLSDLDRVGEVLDALVAAGANTIYGPSFMLENDTAAKALARSMAFESGRRMAEEYARMAGFSTLRLLEVSESVAVHRPYAQPIMARAVAESADASTPIEPGEVATSVTLTVKYEMAR